jgi:hypothetical protein
VFLGEPYPREVSFVDGKYVPVRREGEGGRGKVSLRVALNVALYDSKEVKVLEQGVMFFKDLVRVREKYGLEKWAFEIQRHGAAKDPKTTYSILPSTSSRPSSRRPSRRSRSTTSRSSTRGGERGRSGSAPLGSYDQKSDDGTVDPKVAQGHRDAAQGAAARGGRSLPPEVRRAAHQGPADAQVEKARAFVEQLQTELAAPAATETEVDPFA